MDDCCVRTAIIDPDGVVVNVVIVCPNAECEHHPGTWEAPEGCTLVVLTDEAVSPGDSYAGGVFTPAPPVPVVNPAAELHATLTAENKLTDVAWRALCRQSGCTECEL